MRRWNEKDHPRNPDDGRFRDKIGGVGWARRISDAIGFRRGEQRRQEPRLTRMEDGTGPRDPSQVGGRPIVINGQVVGYESTGPGIRGVSQDDEGLPRGQLDRELAALVSDLDLPAQDAQALNESKHQIITTYVDDLFEVAEDIQNGVFQHDFEEDPDLEDLVNAMADVVMDRPDNWGAMQSAAERLRKYIIRSGYANVAKLPQRPPESTWRRD